MNKNSNSILTVALIIYLRITKIDTINVNQFFETCGNELSTPQLNKCYCDANCRRFDDCCVDCTYQSTSKLRQIRELMKCYPLQINNQTTSYLFIAKCRRKWRDAKVREECEKDTPEALFPITARRSRLVFKNEACANCHKMQLKSRIYWRFFRICQHSDYGIPRCYFNFREPKRKSTLRPCLPNVISSCPPSWEDETIKKLCLNSCSQVYIKDRSEIRIYRNPFCVQCHRENIIESNNQTVFNISKDNVNLNNIQTVLEKLEENKISNTVKELTEIEVASLITLTTDTKPSIAVDILTSTDHQVVQTKNSNMRTEEGAIFDSAMKQKLSYPGMITLHCPEDQTAIATDPLICIPNSDIKCPGDKEFINNSCKDLD